METKDLTNKQLIKKLRKLAREMRLESCMYATAEVLDEAAKRLEEKDEKENN